MKYKHMQNLRGCLNGEKLMEQTIKLGYLESCPNEEKRVEQTNELRLNLDGVPTIRNKRDEE